MRILGSKMSVVKLALVLGATAVCFLLLEFLSLEAGVLLVLLDILLVYFGVR